MFHKLLGETSDNLEHVISQSRKNLHIETTERTSMLTKKSLYSFRDTKFRSDRWNMLHMTISANDLSYQHFCINLGGLKHEFKMTNSRCARSL